MVSWTEGDAWWRYYDKHVDGKLVLRARLSSEPAQEHAFASNDKPAVKETDEHPYRRDKRLNVYVQVEPKRPSVAHVIGRIKEATGVVIEMSPELVHHAPDLGYISPHPKGVFAWQLMDHLGKKDIDNGRWERTKTGYRLTGVSRVPPEPEQVMPVDMPAPPPGEHFSPWWIALGIGLPMVLTAVLIGVLLLLRMNASRSSAGKGDNGRRPPIAPKPKK